MANSGDTVCVAEDTYTEQVVINMDLTLTNVPGDSPTIEAPSSPTVFTLPDSGDWEPVVFAFGGSESGGDVSGSGTVDVNITGFTVDRLSREENFPVGILMRNVRPAGPNEKSSVSDNTVTSDFADSPSSNRTFGMFAEGDSALKLRGNEVENYSRVGIFVDGDEGAGPDPEVNIRNNTVTGPGQPDPDDDDNPDINWAPNGIQVSSGATGNVINNTVTDHWNAATGIIVVDSDEVSIKGNSLRLNETGIFFGSFFAPPPVEKAVIRDNDLFGGAPGDADPWFESGKMDNGVWLVNSHNSKVVKNDFDTWSDGVDIDGDDNNNNKVVNNSFTNVDEELADEDEDNTKNPPNPANP